MALIQRYNKIVYGEELSFRQAYHQITQINATTEGIDVFVNIFKDDTKEVSLDMKTFNFKSNNYASVDLVQVGYKLLKDLPEYSESIDVFEEGQPDSEVITV